MINDRSFGFSIFAVIYEMSGSVAMPVIGTG